jgi:hypothetical protein
MPALAEVLSRIGQRTNFVEDQFTERVRARFCAGISPRARSEGLVTLAGLRGPGT